jgi:hypothetical protein
MYTGGMLKKFGYKPLNFGENLEVGILEISSNFDTVAENLNKHESSIRANNQKKEENNNPSITQKKW